MKSSVYTIESLTISGLSEREARIWHALACAKSMNISQIGQAAHLNRPAVYQHLPTLIKKGLVKKNTKNRRIVYQTTGVKALDTFRISRDIAYAKYVKKMKKTTEDATASLGNEVRVYHGTEIKRVWEIILAEMPKNGIFYRYDGYNSSVPMQIYLPKNYYETIEQKKLERFVITNEGLRKSPYKKKIQCASRMIPCSFDAFEQGISQFIFEDKIALIDFTTQIAYIIKNQALAAYHTRLFQFVFQNLKE